MLADKGNSPLSGPDIVPESGHVAVRWVSQFRLVLVTQRSAFTAVSVFSPKTLPNALAGENGETPSETFGPRAWVPSNGKETRVEKGKREFSK